jgi:tRNA pseudouridine38-40 synthase
LRNVLLTIEYDGTNFSGWGGQPGRRTVQDTIEKAIGRITGEKILLVAASRTDSGVHARGQIANFKSKCLVPIGKIPRVLNSALPEDVVIRKAEDVPLSFDSRRAARSKLYSYVVSCGAVGSPAARRYLWEQPYALNGALMRRAAKTLVGRYDFSSFALNDKRRKRANPLREIYSIRIRERLPKDLFGDLGENSRTKVLKIDVLGKSFLYKMVRGIVGTLVDVGRGRTRPEMMKKILLAGRRSAAGITAPGKGLTLVRVDH